MEGSTAMSIAAAGGYVNIVKLLVDMMQTLTEENIQRCGWLR